MEVTRLEDTHPKQKAAALHSCAPKASSTHTNPAWYVREH